ncbi:ABC-type multidrug transport system, ATPase and permease component [Bacillus sp. 5mfcol3.1]|uniref:ABC transporter ATP-binding protein n=1 Tax=unclassified Bacillus (in: firmicutes) TaxID=185979 RepID=UPI00047C6C94|nr:MULTISPECIES: ABC transporter ATP-binding protein [unclassified Bacillus (in: firmicutes)]SFM34373.1 ABC-type multidrug transport system, ATPase and permease component [Bacillus sp. 5mfcol3.1]
MHTLKKIFFYKKRLLFLIVILIAFTTISSLPLPYFSKYIIDDVLLKGNTSLLYKILLLTLLIVIIQLSIGIIISYLTSSYSQNIVKSIRLHLHTKVLRSESKELLSLDPNHLKTVIFNDSDIVGNSVQEIFLSVISNSLLLILYFFVLLKINFQLALISVLTLPIFFITFYLFRKKIQSLSMSVQTNKDVMFSTLNENISGKKFLQSIESLNNRTFIFQKHLENLKKNTVKLVSINSFFSISLSLISLIGPFGILLYGVVLVKNNTLTIGELMAFYSYAALIYPPLMGLMGVYPKLQVLYAPVFRIKNILETEDSNENGVLAIEKDCAENSIITIKNVTYFTPNDRLIFKGINLSILKGDRVLLKGDNGSGKTTLFEMIIGLKKSYDGNIEILGQNINDLPIQEIFKVVAYVPQENFFFKGSILYNLTLGVSNVELNQVNEMIKAFKLDGFINSLDNEINTEIDKVVTNLSSGQIQKIKLIRSLLYNPKILLIDEAFSNLDNESLISITNYINEKFPNMTVIFVNHNHSNILEQFKNKIYNISNYSLY